MTTQFRTSIPVDAGPAKIIDLSYDSDGQVTGIQQREVANRVNLDNLQEVNGYRPFDALREIKHGGRTIRLPLKEAFLANPDAANILRQDIRLLAFGALNSMPRSFADFTSFEDSNKPQEEYLRDAAIGVIPKAPSGTEAPEMQSGFEGGTIIKNDLYRYIVRVLGDWIRFDQIGKVRQVSAEMGLSGRLTEENAVYSYITTTGNYVRAATTKDNDIGANTQNLTFSARGLETAMNIIATAKDRISGAYLGYSADTLICGPSMMVTVLQLLRSQTLQRASANNAAEVIGTGVYNPFQGSISRIVMSPWFGASFQWALCDSRRASFKFQTVEPFNVLQETPGVTSESWMVMDVVKYLVKGYFGVGFVDDRAWFYSSSTTTPTIS